MIEAGMCEQCHESLPSNYTPISILRKVRSRLGVSSSPHELRQAGETRGLVVFSACFLQPVLRTLLASRGIGASSWLVQCTDHEDNMTAHQHGCSSGSAWGHSLRPAGIHFWPQKTAEDKSFYQTALVKISQTQVLLCQSIILSLVYKVSYSSQARNKTGTTNKWLFIVL